MQHHDRTALSVEMFEGGLEDCLEGLVEVETALAVTAIVEGICLAQTVDESGGEQPLVNRVLRQGPEFEPDAAQILFGTIVISPIE